MKRVGSIPFFLVVLAVLPVLEPKSRASGTETPSAPVAQPAAAPAPAPAPATAPIAAPVAAPPPRSAPVPVPAAPAALAPAPVVRGFAMELSTGGLSSPHGGALALGYASGAAAGGLAVDFRYASVTGPDYPGTTELTQTSIAVGPWLRFTILRPLDGRVDLFGAFDAQYQRQSVTYRPDTSPGGGSASADGFSFRAGPGIRFWATPRIAVGYVTQLSLSTLAGPLLAVSPPSSTLGAATTDSSSTEVALVGRFQVLGVF